LNLGSKADNFFSILLFIIRINMEYI